MTASHLLDPPTSHLAAQRMERSGQAATNREKCLREVRRMPGQTAAEIALMVGLERHEPSRRLPELRRLGLVSNGNDAIGRISRICVVTGNLSVVWMPVSLRTQNTDMTPKNVPVGSSAASGVNTGGVPCE